MSNPLPPSSDPTRQIEQLLTERVSRLLEDRESLTVALDAIAEELPAGRYRHEMQGFVAGLNRGAAADELCRGPKAANLLLPLLASAGQPAMAAGRYQSLFAESYREQEFRRQRRRVLAYPIVVLLTAVAVFIFLSVVVVPVYGQVLDSFELQLPRLTVGVVQLSEWLRFEPIGVVLATLAAVCTLYLLWRLATSLAFFDRIFGGLFSGSSRAVAAMAIFTRRLAEGLAAELPLAVAMQLAGQSTSCRSIQRAARQLANDANDCGDTLETSPAAAWFPATLIHALSTRACPAEAAASASKATPHSEDTGVPDAATSTRVRLLQELAETYSERLHYRWDWATGTLAQFSIVFVGLVVGIVLLALLLPLIDLVSGLS